MSRAETLAPGPRRRLDRRAGAGRHVAPNCWASVRRSSGGRRELRHDDLRGRRHGHADVRLRGSGDWELVVRDADRIAGELARFGGSELVQGWCAASAPLVEGVADGAGSSARVTLRTVRPPCPSARGRRRPARRVSEETRRIAGSSAPALTSPTCRRRWDDVPFRVTQITQLAVRPRLQTRDGRRKVVRRRAHDGRPRDRAPAPPAGLPRSKTYRSTTTSG